MKKRLKLEDLSQFWKKVYAEPVKAEIGWGLFSFLKTATITFIAWLPVLSLFPLIVVTLVDSIKNLLINQYRHTLRNIFNYHRDRGAIINFVLYYLKRVVFHILTGFFVLFAARQLEVFTWDAMYLLVTSKIFNSTRFFVNAYEDKLIYAGYISRATASHIGGSTSLIRAYISNIDLAGITIVDIRPFWLNIAISIIIVSYYTYIKLKSDWRKRHGL